MNPCSLPVGIGALAAVIAEKIPDDAELTLLGAVLTQLGDSLTVIVTARAAQKAACGGEDSPA